MSVKLVTITPDPEAIIAYIARVSNPDNQENPDYVKLIKYCIKNNHWSIFEHASMTLEIETSRAIAAQILRHRSFKFQEFSQRYAKLGESDWIVYDARRQDTKNRQNSIDDLPDEILKEWSERQVMNWSRAYEDYEWALDKGIAKECARMVLPLQTKSRLYMTGDCRSWIHYIQLRTGHGTQKEHMDIANECKHVFANFFPTVAQALEWTKGE